MRTTIRAEVYKFRLHCPTYAPDQHLYYAQNLSGQSAIISASTTRQAGLCEGEHWFSYSIMCVAIKW